jgi:serine/threonine protein kinase
LPDPILHGRYRLGPMLGKGGMGAVYRAQDLRDGGKTCAVKMLRSELTHDARVRRRFVDEAKSLLRLKHPNIVTAFDFFQEGEDCYIALEFVDGMSLADRIDNQRGPLPEAEALALFKGVLAALDHGHQNLIVHRDVKPNNILIDRRTGQARLCDFGIAKQVAERGVTLSGVTLGTAEYMSPEQVQRPDKVDHRSDVYSAGIVLFEMLTGRVPFFAASGDSDFAVRTAQVKSDPPDPCSLNPRLSKELSRIVLKAMRKDLARRYQGCGALLQDIERYERGEPFAAPSVLPTTDATSPASARRRFSVYEHPTLGHEAVKQGFSWPAALLSVAWMFRKRLYVHGLVCAAVYMLAWSLMSAFAPFSAGSAFAALAAFAALWIAPGFRANRWRENDLLRRGFELKAAALEAPNADAAVARAARAR